MTDANREAVEVPAVTPDQERFVSGVRESILEAAEEPDAQAFSLLGDLNPRDAGRVRDDR
jgi:hypothetical protein